jgi:hypothetical protein
VVLGDLMRERERERARAQRAAAKDNGSLRKGNGLA